MQGQIRIPLSGQSYRDEEGEANVLVFCAPEDVPRLERAGLETVGVVGPYDVGELVQMGRGSLAEFAELVSSPSFAASQQMGFVCCCFFFFFFFFFFSCLLRSRVPLFFFFS